MPVSHRSPFLSAMLCSAAAAAAFPGPLTVSLLFPSEAVPSPAAPAARSWEEASGEASEAPRAFASSDHLRGLHQPPAGSVPSLVQMLQSHRTRKFTQELAERLLVCPARQPCPVCQSKSLLGSSRFPQCSRNLDYNQ